MSRVSLSLNEAIRGERGATAVEYALMVSLIVLVIFATVYQIGPELRDTFDQVASSI